ncbi:hypothetical protein BDQ17DRAFT_1423161 [Cyathus striatus]|nr:hypothetical protein BDQ17DRAFT_1423161 [Cyathus striatus]
MFASILRVQPRLALSPCKAPAVLSTRRIFSTNPAHPALSTRFSSTDSKVPSSKNKDVFVPTKHTLYIRYLDDAVQQEDIEFIFSRYGPLRTVFLPRDHNGKVLGFAHVDFENLDDAVNAYEWCRAERVTLYGHQIQARWDNLKKFSRRSRKSNDEPASGHGKRK